MIVGIYFLKLEFYRWKRNTQKKAPKILDNSSNTIIMGNSYKQRVYKSKQQALQEECELNESEIIFMLENTSLNKKQIIELHSRFRVYFI